VAFSQPLRRGVGHRNVLWYRGGLVFLGSWTLVSPRGVGGAPGGEVCGGPLVTPYSPGD